MQTKIHAITKILNSKAFFSAVLSIILLFFSGSQMLYAASSKNSAAAPSAVSAKASTSSTNTTATTAATAIDSQPPASPAATKSTPASASSDKASQTPLPTPVGRVVWVKGSSFKAVMGNKEQRILQKLSIIYLHDMLITDDKTQAEIVFTDNTLITFRPATQYSVDEYSFSGAKGKKGSVGKYIMRLLEGGFRTITGLIAKSNPPDYQINTPVATIGVRGTDYTVQLKGGELFIEYLTGSPCVSSNKGGGTLCLDKDRPYGRVQSSSSAPQALTEKPAVFKNSDQLDVTPASIAGFGSYPGGGSGGGASTPGGRSSGPITSFCISQ